MAFGTNFSRLIGMHALTARQAAQLLDVTPQTVSSWINNRGQPRFNARLKIAEVFEVPADRLATSRFAEVLDLIADTERFERVEARIQAAGVSHGGS